MIENDDVGWQPADINECGHASTVADWKEISPADGPCDSLMDFMHQTLPLHTNPKASPQTVFIHWADFKGKYTGRDGFTVPRGGQTEHYVFLRRNYPPNVPWARSPEKVKGHKYEALAHELRHVMRKDSVHDVSGGVDTDGCTKRRVDKEHQPEDPTVSRWPETARVTSCTITTHWKCQEVTFPTLENPEEVEEEVGGTPGSGCALFPIADRWYYACPGETLRVCLSQTEIRCPRRRGGGLGRAACAVPDADALRPRSGIRAAE